MKLARPKNSRRSEITFAARTRRSVFNLPSGAFLGEDGTSGGRSTGDRDRRDRTDQPASGLAFPLQNPARWHGAEARRRPGQAGEFDQRGVWASADRIEQGDRVLFDAMPGSEGVDHLPEFFDGKAWSLDSPHMEGRVWIQACEHLVDPTVARRGDEISRLVGGGFSGSLHEQPDGENDGPDGERDPRRDENSTFITLDRNPANGGRHDGEEHREWPRIFQYETGEEAGTSGIGHGAFPKLGESAGRQATGWVQTIARHGAYPFEEVVWDR